MTRKTTLMGICISALVPTIAAHAGDFDVVGPAVDGYYLGANQLTADDFEFGDYFAAGIDTWRIFLAGGNSDDGLTAIFGDSADPMSITTEDGSNFFNAAEEDSHFAPNPLFFRFFPSLQWDTYLAIGESEEVMVSPGFPDIALPDGGGNINGFDNGAWFDSYPGTPETIGEGVLIGQFSWNGSTTGAFTLNAQINTADDETIQIRGLSVMAPGPSVLALFAMAGLAGAGRRRS